LLKYAKKTRRNLNHEEKQISLNDMSIYKKISKLSLGIINNTHFNYIFNRRRENYIFLHQLLQNVKSNHLQIMFEKTQAGIAPLAFPLVVKERRENLLNYLFLKGFVAYSWPDLPRDIAKNNDYTTENFLSNTMVLLPIHEGMKRRHINKMVLSIEEWAKKFD
jgi:dTDP-4-amino-4,6-dideoxygalactose transaminase